MRSIPLRSAFGIEARDSKGLGFYPAEALENEPYLAQAMMGIDVDNNVYSAQVSTTSVYENDIWYEKVNTQEWQKMMSRVKQGLSPTEETVVDSATGTVMSSAGTGGSGSGDSGSKNSSSSSSLSGVKIAVKNGSGIQGCANETASKLSPRRAPFAKRATPTITTTRRRSLYTTAPTSAKRRRSPTCWALALLRRMTASIPSRATIW